MRLWCIWCIGNYSFWSCFVFLFFLVWWSIDLFVLFLNFYNLNERDVNRGLVPAVAEMRYLDRVKWLDLYGVDLHPVLVSCPAFCTSPLQKKNHFQNKNLSRFFYSCTEWTKKNKTRTAADFAHRIPQAERQCQSTVSPLCFLSFVCFVKIRIVPRELLTFASLRSHQNVDKLGENEFFIFFILFDFLKALFNFGVVFFRYLGPSAILESSHFASLAV